MNPVLILSSFPDYYNNLLNSQVPIIVGYKNTNLFIRGIRKLLIKLPFVPKSFWFSKKLKQIENYDEVIIFINDLTLLILKWLLTKYPNKRYIVWYWNPISKCTAPKRIPKSPNIQIYTFDSVDAQLYNIKYVESFSICSLKENNKTYNSKFDIYFVGKDKGRYKILERLINIFEKNKLSFKIDLIRDSTSRNIESSLYSEYLSYKEVLNNIHNAKCILEIVQDNQTGLTQRVFEGLAYGKKIITNNKAIIETKIYDPQRIYILDFDHESNLMEFINSPLPNIDPSILYYYSLEGWIKRLLE